jgi:hypothetical protein
LLHILCLPQGRFRYDIFKMIFLSFYRLFASLCAGLLVYLLFGRNAWIALACAIAFRTIWFFIERIAESMAIDRHFRLHVYEFKQQLGPYGIRMANKADGDRRIKKSLAEAFVPDVKKLQKAHDQLKLLDALYSAGMRPDAEAWQLHDCKLKYAAYRLEKHRKMSDE